MRELSVLLECGLLADELLQLLIRHQQASAHRLVDQQSLTDDAIEHGEAQLGAVEQRRIDAVANHAPQ